MAQRGITEFDAKRMLATVIDGYAGEVVLVRRGESLKDKLAANPWLAGRRLVAKPDQLFGKRGKNKLIGLNLDVESADAWIAERMASLMEEVLLLGMVEAGKMEFRPGRLKLRVFCERVVSEVLAATERKCVIRFSAPDLPAQAVGDDRLLTHIFSNLLTNAVKYSPSGSTVEFLIGRESGQAVCRFIDHGIGIPEADLGWVFRGFHRGRNVGHVPGSGLGLTIVKRCVELHGGSIHIQSRIGEGTTVEVQLPLFVEQMFGSSAGTT